MICIKNSIYVEMLVIMQKNVERWCKHMNKMIENIKQIQIRDVCLFRMGGFYHTYGKDSYILSYFFGYKIKDIGNNIFECGFPVNSISKVMRKLEDNKINYLVIDTRNNYDVEEKLNYRNLNRYEKFAEKAKVYINAKRRIEDINNYLMNNIYEKDINKTIIKIEKVMKEG